MVYLAIELVGPWVVFAFRVGLEVFDELSSINVHRSEEFSSVFRICMVCFALEPVGPWVMLAFSVGMKVLMSSY